MANEAQTSGGGNGEIVFSNKKSEIAVVPTVAPAVVPVAAIPVGKKVETPVPAVVTPELVKDPITGDMVTKEELDRLTKLRAIAPVESLYIK